MTDKAVVLLEQSLKEIDREITQDNQYLADHIKHRNIYIKRYEERIADKQKARQAVSSAIVSLKRPECPAPPGERDGK